MKDISLKLEKVQDMLVTILFAMTKYIANQLQEEKAFCCCWFGLK